VVVRPGFPPLADHAEGSIRLRPQDIDSALPDVDQVRPPVTVEIRRYPPGPGSRQVVVRPGTPPLADHAEGSIRLRPQDIDSALRDVDLDRAAVTVEIRPFPPRRSSDLVVVRPGFPPLADHAEGSIRLRPQDIDSALPNVDTWIPLNRLADIDVSLG